jgi:hypothetical protein
MPSNPKRKRGEEREKREGRKSSGKYMKNTNFGV